MNDTPQQRPRVTVAAVVEQEGRFLLVEEIDHGVAVLNQPAGHMEFGESPQEAVIRETLEETGWIFHPTHLQGIYQSVDPVAQRHYLRLAFTGQVVAHQPHSKLDEVIIRTLWLTLEEVLQQQQRLRSPMVLRCIEDYFNDESYPLTLFHNHLPPYTPPRP